MRLPGYMNDAVAGGRVPGPTGDTGHNEIDSGVRSPRFEDKMANLVRFGSDSLDIPPNETMIALVRPPGAELIIQVNHRRAGGWPVQEGGASSQSKGGLSWKRTA